MSTQITTMMIEEFKSGIEIAFQQMESKLRNSVRVEPLNGKYTFFDQIGAVEAKEKTTRHADIETVDTPHMRRRVSSRDYYVADYVDMEDLLRILQNPADEYYRTFVAALNRKLDSLIINAALGTAYTGVDGSTTVSFDSNMTVAVDVGDSSATGLNIDKLIAAKELLDENEVPDEDRYVVVAPKQLSNLLGTTEVTSSDYNTVKALVQGDLDTFLGFKFIKSNRLTTDGNGYREVLFYQKRGLLLGMAREIGGSLDNIPQKGHAILVQAWVSAGATRMHESAVGKILCAES